MYRFVSAFLFGAAALTAASSQAEASAYKQFGAWDVYCTNALDCDMRSSTSGEGAVYGLTFHRKAGPEAPVTFGFAVKSEALPADARLTDVSFTFDDGKTIRLDAAAIHFDEDLYEWPVLEDAVRIGLGEAMHAGKTMKLLIKAADGKTVESDFSLSGVAASFLFMDDQQNRVGHTDALGKKGDLPPSPPPPIREISSFDAFPKEIRPIFDDSGECGFLEESRLSPLGAFVYSFGEDEKLYGAPCGSPGAYNAPFVLYYKLGSYLKELAFPVMIAEGPSTMSGAYNIDFDFKTMTITSFFKGRGIGDCGSYYEWKVVDGVEGKSLVLQQQNEKGDCDGEYDGGPENWPKLWPLR